MTGRALPLEQDLGDLVVDLRPRVMQRRDDHFDVRQAFDLAADGAHEVGVFAMFVVVAAAEFKPPDVVA